MTKILWTAPLLLAGALFTYESALAQNAANVLPCVITGTGNNNALTCVGNGAAGSVPMPVSGVSGGTPVSVSGFDSGSAPIQTATPNSSSHSAGQSVGGLFQIPVARTAGGSGEIENILWISSGGDTTQKMVRLWDKKPTNTTCTDQTAYAGSATDDQHLLFVPFTFTPAAPASTTGDAKTYGNYAFIPPISFKNQDSVATQYVYACVVTTATDTADESNAVYINATGPQN